MAKKDAAKASKPPATSSASLTSLLADKTAVDPALASLFASSSGPVKKSPKNTPTKPSKHNSKPEATHTDDDVSEAGEPEANSQESLSEPEDSQAKQSRKRKRKTEDDELEDTYLRKLARQEEKEEAQRQVERVQKLKDGQAEGADSNGEDDDEEDQDEEAEDESAEPASEDGEDDDDDEAQEDADMPDFDIPVHESLAPSKNDIELDKAARTVFLGNVSTEAITSKSANKTLMQHLTSFIPSLPEQKPPHKVESFRFRSTPFASAIPKKAAFAKKELMDATTKSTNAYVVYSTQLAAKEAAKRLNGTVVLERHLRVDLVAHPAKVDNRRCVFVGNLGFVDDETSIREAEAENGKKTKAKPPSDVEEGLWQHFSKAGPVESVRVVRDAKTRVGKGFAYVQFKDENAVETALLFNDKKFPPLLPRTLRVVRAKAIKRKDVKKRTAGGLRDAAQSNGVYNPKPDSRKQSYLGRAGKLFGRAGAAQARSTDGAGFKTPENFIFEGHRASAKQGKTGFKFNKSSSKKKTGKPQNRSSKRGAAWKAAGGKKN